VVDVYGSWEKFLQHAEIPSSPLLARVREADGERKSVAARQQQAERDLARVEDLRRQVETAKRRREAADTERSELSARAERLAGQLERAEVRAAAAEAHLAERRQHAESAVGPRGEASDEWLAAHEALLDELDTVRAHREELLRQVEELREAAEQDAKAIAHLSTTLGETAAAAEVEGPAAEPLEPPATVAEAVERAAAQAEHLVFTRAAHEAAADSPYRRPADVLDTLMRLDELAGLYADPEGFGRSLSQAADELGLTWRQNVSGVARSRKPHAYSVVHDGERLELGPHVAIGSGSGAGFIARVYLHVADGSGNVPRGLYVGHVGRHLPDTTTA
jgi:predicted  nucleic acid-binding Zn-ribbon protein